MDFGLIYSLGLIIWVGKMGEIWNEKINKYTDWGGDSSTLNLPVSGFRVLEFIKELLENRTNSHVGEFNADMTTEEGWYDSIVLGRPEGSESDEKYFMYQSSNGGQICFSRRNSGKVYHRLGNGAAPNTDWHPWVPVTHDDYSLLLSSSSALNSYYLNQTISVTNLPDITASDFGLAEVYCGYWEVEKPNFHLCIPINNLEKGSIIKVRCFYRWGEGSINNDKYNSDAYIYLSNSQEEGHDISKLMSDFIKVKSLGSTGYPFSGENENLEWVRTKLFTSNSDYGYHTIKCNNPVDGTYYLHICGDFTVPRSWFVIDTVEVYSPNKAYIPLTYNGMGKVNLQKNLINGVNTLTLDMFYKGETGNRVPNTNTTYVIQYDYDLANETITVPENCILEFDGGSLSNGNIIGQNTSIVDTYAYIFRNVVLSGTFNVPYIRVENFGLKASNTAIENDTCLHSCVLSINAIKVPLISTSFNEYYISEPVVFDGYSNIILDCTFVYSGSINATAMTIGCNTLQNFRQFRINVSQYPTVNYGEPDEQDLYVIPENYGVIFKNIAESEIYVKAEGFAYDIAILADNAIGVVKNIIYPHAGRKHSVGLLLRAINDGWINENIIEGYTCGVGSSNPLTKQTIGIFLDAYNNNHSINNNVFIKPCVEGHYIGVKYSGARNNTFIALRNENVNITQQVDDGSKSSYNNIILFAANTETTGEAYDKVLGGIALNISELGNSCLKQVFEIRSLERFTNTTASAHTIHYSSVVTAVLGKSISYHALNGEPVYGHILDVSNSKNFVIETDLPSSSTPCIYIEVLDSLNTVQYIENITDIIKKNNSVVLQNINQVSYIRAGAGKNKLRLCFTDNVDRVFIGMHNTCKRMTVSTIEDNNIIDDGNIGKRFIRIPDIEVNTKIGYSTIYDGKPIWWNGTAWVDATGTRVTWPITYTLTNIVASNTSKPETGQSYTTVLVADEGYTLPETITVKIDNTTLIEGTDYTYNNTPEQETTGQVVILGNGGTGGITGALTIIASGVPVEESEE